MPEKVYRRFDDAAADKKPSGKSKTLGSRPFNALSPATPGKRRKRDDGNSHKATGGSTHSQPRTPAVLKTSVPLKLNGDQHQTTLPVDDKNCQEMHGAKPDRSLAASSALDSNHSSLKAQAGVSVQSRVVRSLKEKAKKLQDIRNLLPISSKSGEIRQCLKEKDVVLLVGETGSGKSTQVPQFLVDEPWCRSQSVRVVSDGGAKKVTIGGCIAITEPRRVAAITLARRVAEEMGTPLGSSSPASRVGYSVRFDTSISPNTRIKFLTEGMLLQEMLRDPWLRQYSAVIVDEVHERGVNVDLVMGFLKNMVSGSKEGRGGIPLKVAVMSATADMEGLIRFFEEGCDHARLKVVTDPASQQIEHVESAGLVVDEYSEWSGISSSDDEKPKKAAPLPSSIIGQTDRKRTSKDGTSKGLDHNKILRLEVNGHSSQKTQDSPVQSPVQTCYIEGRQYPVNIHYSPEPVQDFVDASLRTIFQIHCGEPLIGDLPGDILVFLTGQETVETLEKLVTEHALNMRPDVLKPLDKGSDVPESLSIETNVPKALDMGPNVPKLLVLPLFAALPQAAQQRVFQRAPQKTRKVILATNIAETSVTISGVRFVIDCGKSKIKQFRTRLGLDSLLVKPISKSAAIQRKGRAGREATGQCYRLYTEQDYLALQASNTPEILRCDLSQSILTMKARGVDDMLSFPFLDRPPREALEKALVQLFQLGALTEAGNVSDIGLQMAKLPLSASMGRVLLAATDPSMDCLSDAIDIISSLTVENIFLNLTSEEKKEAAEAARHSLFRREGDHLTLLIAVQAYAAERSDRKVWAEKHFVSHRAMQAVMDVRKQLRAQCRHLKLDLADSEEELSSMTSERASLILKCFLKGFATNTARLFPDGSYKTIVGNQTVANHPSSGLFGKKMEAIMYNEFVFTNRSYARGVSAVQMDWIADVLGVNGP